MSARLQLAVEDTELAEYKRLASRDGMTLVEWVRQELRRAAHDQSIADVERKLAAIRAAAAHRFPALDID